MKYSPVITSRSNARVKALRASFSGSAAKPGDVVGVEGAVLLDEAARAGMRFEAMYCREGCEQSFPQAILNATASGQMVRLSKDVFDSAVGAVSPQGVAATMRIPQTSAPTEGIWLVLEDLQDPGNLGTLLRTAEAFDVSAVYVTAKTVSVWNPKAMRASAGSVFRVPVMRCELSVVKTLAWERRMRVFAAVVKAEGATAVMDADLSSRYALLIGNEGAGLSQEALALCDERIHIPCAIESLNAAVAGATLMYEGFRQRLLAQARRDGSRR